MATPIPISSLTLTATPTASLETVSTDSLMSIINNWIGYLSFFSGVIIGLGSLILMVVGGAFVYFSWKQNVMKKQAEKEMKKIIEIREKTEDLYKKFTQLLDQSRGHYDLIEEYWKRMQKQVKASEVALNKIKEKGTDVKKIYEDLKATRQQIDSGLNSLTTISGSIPSASLSPSVSPSVSPSASPSKASKLSDLVGVAFDQELQSQPGSEREKK